MPNYQVITPAQAQELQACFLNRTFIQNVPHQDLISAFKAVVKQHLQLLQDATEPAAIISANRLAYLQDVLILINEMFSFYYEPRASYSVGVTLFNYRLTIPGMRQVSERPTQQILLDWVTAKKQKTAQELTQITGGKTYFAALVMRLETNPAVKLAAGIAILSSITAAAAVLTAASPLLRPANTEKTLPARKNGNDLLPPQPVIASIGTNKILLPINDWKLFTIELANYPDKIFDTEQYDDYLATILTRCVDHKVSKEGFDALLTKALANYPELFDTPIEINGKAAQLPEQQSITIQQFVSLALKHNPVLLMQRMLTLVEQGLNINTYYPEGMNYILNLCQMGALDFLQEIVEASIKANIAIDWTVKSPNGHGVLSYALMSGNPAMMQYVLQYQQNVLENVDKGMNPLAIALDKEKFTAATKELLRYQGKEQLTSIYPDTPENRSRSINGKNIFDIAIQFRESSSIQFFQFILETAQELGWETDIFFAKCEGGLTPYGVAFIAGNAKVVDFYLKSLPVELYVKDLIHNITFYKYSDVLKSKSAAELTAKELELLTHFQQLLQTVDKRTPGAFHAGIAPLWNANYFRHLILTNHYSIFFFLLNDSYFKNFDKKLAQVAWTMTPESDRKNFKKSSANFLNQHPEFTIRFEFFDNADLQPCSEEHEDNIENVAVYERGKDGSYYRVNLTNIFNEEAQQQTYDALASVVTNGIFLGLGITGIIYVMGQLIQTYIQQNMAVKLLREVLAGLNYTIVCNIKDPSINIIIENTQEKKQKHIFILPGYQQPVMLSYKQIKPLLSQFFIAHNLFKEEKEDVKGIVYTLDISKLVRTRLSTQQLRDSWLKRLPEPAAPKPVRSSNRQRFPFKPTANFFALLAKGQLQSGEEQLNTQVPASLPPVALVEESSSSSRFTFALADSSNGTSASSAAKAKYNPISEVLIIANQDIANYYQESAQTLNYLNEHAAIIASGLKGTAIAIAEKYLQEQLKQCQGFAENADVSDNNEPELLPLSDDEKVNYKNKLLGMLNYFNYLTANKSTDKESWYNRVIHAAQKQSIIKMAEFIKRIDISAFAKQDEQLHQGWKKKAFRKINLASTLFKYPFGKCGAANPFNQAVMLNQIEKLIPSFIQELESLIAMAKQSVAGCSSRSCSK